MQEYPGHLAQQLEYKLLWGLCGAFLAGLLGTLMILWKKKILHGRKSFLREMARFTGNKAGEPELEVYLQNIEARLEDIMELNRELRDKMSWLEGQVRVLLSRRETEPVPKSLEEQVYAAYDRGKPITEIARECGRDKGEIELILNIRRLKKK